MYVMEENSDLVKKWVSEAEMVATYRVAYPDTMSAINRRFKQGDFTEQQYRSLIAKFSSEWERFVSIGFDELNAGHLVKRYGLRGFDAVHLSAAIMLKVNYKDILLSFYSFDEKLNSAATAEGFTILSVN